MESLKLSPKQVDRNNLYFNKYLYKASLKTDYLNFIYYANSIEDFNEKIIKASKERNSWSRHIDLNKVDSDLIEKLINFRNQNRSNQNVIIRLEYNSMSIYTNEIDLLNYYYDLAPKKVKFYRVGSFTPGVMLFAKEPKFKYRVYLRSKKMPDNFRDEFYKFITTHPSVTPCDALVENLKKYSGTISWRYPIPHRGMYLEYNEESTVLLVHLMFPGLAGKTFKLEKRQG